MFLTSQMMILIKEKANCAAPARAVHQSSKHQCQGDVFISFKASLKMLSSNCYERAVLVYWKRRRTSLKRNFNFGSFTN